MLQAGLTGNIASGKSNAARVFAELGAKLIDADKIAHRVMSPGNETYEKVVEAFGTGILRADGTIDRRILGGIVFSREEKRLLLNGLVHPVVRTEVEQGIAALAAADPRAIIVVDAALMIETGYYRIHDYLIVVACSPEQQLSRLMARDRLSREEAGARIAAQMPAEEKLKLADFKIDTSGTLRETREQIEVIYRQLLSLESNQRALRQPRARE